MLNPRQEAETEDRLGLELIAGSSIEAAIAAFSRAVSLDPSYPQAHLDLGAALRLVNRREEAIQAFSKALDLQPGWPEALYNLGLTLLDAGDVTGALAAFRKARDHKPDWNLAHSGLGMAHLAANDLGEAEASFQKAFELDPRLHTASHFLAMILWMKGATPEAVSVYREGLRQSSSSCQDCHLALSLALLKCGEYKEGWSEYEWRWRCEGQTPRWEGVDAPLWDGTSLEGRRILLWAEQGLGDILQFVRFATILQERGGTVAVLSRPSLDRLLATCFGIARAGSRLEDLGEFDVQLPLASLPRVLGITLDDLPAVEVPYLSPPHPRKEDPFGPRTGDELRVGIVWGVDSGQPNWIQRSCPLPAFRPLESIPGVELYSLQFGARAEELHQPDAPRMADLSAVLGDFAQTAALVEHLDLVITVDTSMAHLAGALGKQVWTLLHHESDWRWLRGRTDSPWYPTMRLLRQEEPGRWETVIEQAATALHALRPSSGLPAVPQDEARLLTVGMPVHNGAAYIGLAIESVLRQNYENFELLIVDDGSTDNTKNIIAGYADPRIRRISGEHSGVAKARNRIVQEAQGDYIVWLDHDDILLPRTLSAYAKCASICPEAAVFYGDLQAIDAEGRGTGYHRYLNFIGDDHLLAHLVVRNLLPMPGTMVRRSVLSEAGAFDEDLWRSSDYDLWLRIAAARLPFQHVGRTVVRYRTHEGNLSSDRAAVAREDLKILHKMLARFGLQDLCSDLDWQDERKARSRARARISGIFQQRGDLESARIWQAQDEILVKRTSWKPGRGPAIYYLCPDLDKPCGGIKQIYRHVDLLNRNGFLARVVHATPGFRCTWFENETQVLAGPALVTTGLDDFFVLPEVWPNLEATARGFRKVIFNQGCYLTFQQYPVWEPPAGVAYLDPEVLATMVVSEDSAAYLRFVFPHLDVARIHNGFDASRFRFSAAKKDRIAFLGTKNLEDLTQVANILRLRGRIDGYELMGLWNKKESEVAEILHETAIFLNFGNREGFPLPPAEAMACGCLVVGYHGRGGKEYFLPDFSYPIQDGDILGFVTAVEEVVRLRRENPGMVAEKAQAASAFIRERYSLDREEQDVVAFWSRMMAAPPLEDRSSRAAA